MPVNNTPVHFLKSVKIRDKGAGQEGDKPVTRLAVKKMPVGNRVPEIITDGAFTGTIYGKSFDKSFPFEEPETPVNRGEINLSLEIPMQILSRNRLTGSFNGTADQPAMFCQFTHTLPLRIIRTLFFIKVLSMRKNIGPGSCRRNSMETILISPVFLLLLTFRSSML